MILCQILLVVLIYFTHYTKSEHYRSSMYKQVRKSYIERRDKDSLHWYGYWWENVIGVGAGPLHTNVAKKCWQQKPGF